MAVDGNHPLLHTALCDEHVPLAKRLTLAKNLFLWNGEDGGSLKTSADIKTTESNYLLYGKEQIVLDWLCSFSSQNERPEAWQTLAFCLKSKQLQMLIQDNRVSLGKDFITFSVNSLKGSQPENLQIVLECISVVLDLPELFSLGQQDIRTFSDFLENVLRALNHSNEGQDLSLKLAEATISFQRQQTNQEELFSMFLENVLSAVLEHVTKSSDNLQLKWKTIAENVIFSDSMQNDWRRLAIFCLSEQTSIDLSKPGKIFVSRVHKLSTENAESLSVLFAVIGNGYLRRYKYKETEGLQLFAVFCGLLGIIPSFKEDKTLIGSKPEIRDFLSIPNLSRDVQYKCLLHLLEPLQNRGLDFYAAAKEITWLEFLQGLTRNVILAEEDFHVKLVPLIKTLTEIHPSIVNSVITKVVRVCLTQFAAGNFASEAANLLKFLLETSQKLRNVPKFVGFILNALNKMAENQQTQMIPFPETFLRDFSEKIALLPVNQSFSIWSSLTEALQNQLNLFKSSPSESVKGKTASFSLFVFQAVAEMFNSVVLDIKLADYTLPQETILEATKLIEDLKKLLQTLAPLAMQDTEALAETFLKLVFAYGELHQLLLLYSRPYAEKHKQEIGNLKEIKTLEPLPSLEPFHQFPDKLAWNQLFEKTNNSSVWFLLTLQKLRAAVLFQNLSKNSLEPCISFLCQRLERHGEIFAENLEYLLGFLSADQMADVCYHLVDQHNEKWKAALGRSAVVDDARVQMGVLQAILQRLQARQGKRKHDSSALVSSKWRSALKKLCKAPGVWIHHRDKLGEDCAAAAREAAETLTETMKCGQPSSGHITQDDVVPLLDILEKLPLESATNSIRIVVQLGLVAAFMGLAPDCSVQAQDKLWMSLLRTIDSTSRPSRLFEHIPSSIFLSWALASLKNCSVYGLAITTLIGEAAATPQSLRSLSDWTKALTSVQSEEVLPILTVAMETLWKAVQNSTGAVKKKLAAKNFHRLRRVYLKSIDSALKQPVIALRGATSTLAAYFDDLSRRALKAKADEESNAALGKPVKVKRLLAKLAKLTKIALDGVASSSEEVSQLSVAYLEIVSSNQKFLKNYAPRSIRQKIFDAYRKSRLPSRWKDVFLEKLLTTAKEKELRQITNGLIEDIAGVSSLEQGNVESFRRAVALLGHLLAAEIQPDSRFAVRLHAVQSTLPVLERIVVSEGARGTSLEVILEAAEVFRTLLNVEKPYAYPQDVASCLQVCLAIPLNVDQPTAEFQACFSMIYKLLNSLVKRHGEIAADRIPVVVQVFRKLLTVVASRSDQNRRALESEVAELADCAERLARLTSVLSNQRLRYRRVATYLVAEIVDQFQKATLYPSVKHFFLTALYNLLDMVDQHAPRFLLAALPPGATELFRNEYDMFQKYHKFTGKV